MTTREVIPNTRSRYFQGYWQFIAKMTTTFVLLYLCHRGEPILSNGEYCKQWAHGQGTTIERFLRTWLKLGETMR